MSAAKDFQEAMKNYKKGGKVPGGGGGNLPLPRNIFLILLLVLAVWGAYSCFYIVEHNERAVVLRFGKYIGTYNPGPHFKLPFGIDKMYIVKTKYTYKMEFGYRTAYTKGTKTTYSSRNFDHESLMLTGDLNIVEVNWEIQYRISNPYNYLFVAKDPSKTIRDITESIMRRVIGDRLANEAIRAGKTAIELEAKELLQETLNNIGIGVTIASVLLQDVIPPKEVKDSYNEVEEAKQERERLITEAQKSYNRVIPEAKGKAEEVIAKAEGYAQGLVQTAKGDANKFSQVLKSYRKAPAITRRRIYLETMEELFTRFEEVTIVDSKVKGMLPVFNTEKIKASLK